MFCTQYLFTVVKLFTIHVNMSKMHYALLQLNQKTFYSVNVNKLNKRLNKFEWNASIIGRGGGINIQ